MGSETRSWDGAAAKRRVSAWAGGPEKDSIDWSRYRKAFLWYDAEDAENLGAYKFPFADIEDGELKAIPAGLSAALSRMHSGPGGGDMPEEDMATMRAHVAQYYKKMQKDMPDEMAAMAAQDDLADDYEFAIGIDAEQDVISTDQLSPWKRILPVGEFVWHGKKLSITYGDLVKTADNFRANVLGAGVPVDMPEHLPDTGGAFGWVEELEARSDGLYARFRWTVRGVEAFSKRLFRSVSAWWGKWKTTSGKTVDLVLKGVSPTTRPFFADAGTLIAASALVVDEEAMSGANPPVSDPDPAGSDITVGSNGAQEEGNSMANDSTIDPTPATEPDVQVEPKTVQATAAPAGSDGDKQFNMDDVVANVSAAIDAKYAAKTAGLEAEVKLLREKQAATEGEMMFARVDGEVSAWHFTMPGGLECKFSPYLRNLIARTLLSVDEELSASLRATFSDDKAFADGFVPIGELSGNPEPDADAESEDDKAFNGLPEDTRAQIMAIMAKRGCSREEAREEHFSILYGIH